MVRAAIVFGVVALGFVHEPGCGSGDSPASGVNAPCTRNKDCGRELACRDGVCTSPDAGIPADAGAEDAADDGG